MIAPLKLVWKFWQLLRPEYTMDLNRNMVYTGLQLGKNKDLVVKVWLPSWNEPNCWFFPSRNKLCIPDVYFCDFLLLPSISTSIQESSSICLIWYGSGCVQNAALRMLPSSMPFHSLLKCAPQNDQPYCRVAFYPEYITLAFRYCYFQITSILRQKQGKLLPCLQKQKFSPEA